MQRVSLYKLAEDLVYKAWMDGFMIGSPTELLVRRIHEGKSGWLKLPDRCKPGGLIKTLKTKERNAVKKLKPEHFNHRYPR